MKSTYTDRIAFYYGQTHERVLGAVEGLNNAQAAWQPAATAHSIAWSLWHLARWADHFHAAIARMTPDLEQRLGRRRQIWEQDRLAERWGWCGVDLGYEESGMLMDIGTATTLAFPDKRQLMAYARRAFAAAERAVAAIDDAQWLAPDGTSLAYYAGLGQTPPRVSTVGDAVLEHLSHENRHLGEIECLRGMQGLCGSATQ